MLIRVSVVLFILFYQIFAFGQQTKRDSIVLQKIAYFAYKNSDSMLYYSRIMLQSKDTCISLNGKLNVATAYYRKGDYQTSENGRDGSRSTTWSWGTGRNYEWEWTIIRLSLKFSLEGTNRWEKWDMFNNSFKIKCFRYGSNILVGIFGLKM